MFPVLLILAFLPYILTWIFSIGQYITLLILNLNCLTEYKLYSHFRDHFGAPEYVNVQNWIKCEQNVETKVESPTGCTCDECRDISSKDLIYHTKNLRTTRREYKCQDCNEVFKFWRSWAQHRKNIHVGGDNYKCEECGKVFKSLEYYYGHVMGIHEKNRTTFVISAASASLDTTRWLGIGSPTTRKISDINARNAIAVS